MASESTPIPELIRRHRADLVHFHANDPNLKGPGFGELDFKPILATLNEIGYGGWVSVEVFDYTPGPERLREKASNICATAGKRRAASTERRGENRKQHRTTSSPAPRSRLPAPCFPPPQADDAKSQQRRGERR